MSKKYKKRLKELGKITKYDVWNLDVELAHFLIPRLKRYKKTKKGIPALFIDDDYIDENWDKHKKEYNLILDKIIRAFELIKSDDFENIEKDSEVIEEGLKLFIEHLQGMWT
jgi:hypothetical protein